MATDVEWGAVVENLNNTTQAARLLSDNMTSLSVFVAALSADRDLWRHRAELAERELAALRGQVGEPRPPVGEMTIGSYVA